VKKFFRVGAVRRRGYRGPVADVRY